MFLFSSDIHQKLIQYCESTVFQFKIYIYIVVYYLFVYSVLGISQVVQEVKNLLANAGNIRDEGTTPGLGRSPGGGYGNSL